MTEHLDRRIPWPRVLIEGLVIVVSVLLALAADAWWDQRQAGQQEQIILAGLEADFEATLRVIAEERAANERTASVAERLISLGGTASGQISAEAMDTLLAELLPGNPFVAVDATLGALLGSGGLRAVSDPELRAMLAEWPPLIAAIRRHEDSNETQFNARFLPYLYDRVPVRTLDKIGSPHSGGQASAFSRDARQLLADLRFENHVNDVLFYHRSINRDLDTLQEHITRTLALIRAQREAS